ncbi:NIPSNAP family protein [Paenibacillus sp. Y412MC10]|uniref:NIPSNAP family protein n=1 Tax=Geobacillus sp. (strain Y412MC10) TaxID=481743 RepID=UPI0011AAF0AB|nr:NIPSNAP family protein [Paenibacillus sp. Y412MC10]
MLYELRIYTIYEGRMDAIQDRFKEHTFRIFARLGMKVVNFWIDATGQNKLYYLMEFEDMAQRQRLWEQFKKDIEWIQVKRNSEENGGLIVEKIDEYFMNQAEFFRLEN